MLPPPMKLFLAASSSSSVVVIVILVSSSLSVAQPFLPFARSWLNTRGGDGNKTDKILPINRLFQRNVGVLYEQRRFLYDFGKKRRFALTCEILVRPTPRVRSKQWEE